MSNPFLKDRLSYTNRRSNDYCATYYYLTILRRLGFAGSNRSHLDEIDGLNRIYRASEKHYIGV